MDPILDQDFVKRLHKEVDKSLDVEWCPTQKRWVIYYNNTFGERIIITVIRNEDDSYRPLDTRTIELLQKWSKTVNDPKYIFSEQYRKMKEYRQIQKRKHREQMRDKSRDMGQLKWKHAMANYNNGIISPRQFGRQVVYSLPLNINPKKIII